jgi:hypothetical protein
MQDFRFKIYLQNSNKFEKLNIGEVPYILGACTELVLIYYKCDEASWGISMKTRELLNSKKV